MRRAGWLAAIGCIGIASIGRGATTEAYYRVEGTGTATTLADSSGNGNTATTTGSPVYSSSTPGSTVPGTGQSDTSSLLLNGSSQYATAPGSASLNFASTAAITIEAYVKLNVLATGTGSGQPREYVALKKAIPSADSTLNYCLVAQEADLGSNLGPHAATSGNQLAFQYGTGSVTETIASSLTITDTNWHFISIAFDPSSGSVRFTDDSAVDSFTISGPPTPEGSVSEQSLLIGGHINSTSALDFPFSGSIDELRISSGFLTTSQLLNAPEPAGGCAAFVVALGLLRRRRNRR